MKRLLVLISLLLAVVGCRPTTSEPKVTFYLQFVRGSDRDTPPTAEAKPIGPKLNYKLRSVWGWKSYWELKRDSIVVSPGQRARKRLSPEREVEIELLDPHRMAARIYLNGTLTRSRTQPAERAFCISGGDEGRDQSWFIVVRRDPPPA
jgi:hypothetical protein